MAQNATRDVSINIRARNAQRDLIDRAAEAVGNNDSNGYYLEQCKKHGLKPHPARFPLQLPSFFLRFLTEPDDLVLDPFARLDTGTFLGS